MSKVAGAEELTVVERSAGLYKLEALPALEKDGVAGLHLATDFMVDIFVSLKASEDGYDSGWSISHWPTFSYQFSEITGKPAFPTQEYANVLEVKLSMDPLATLLHAQEISATLCQAVELLIAAHQSKLQDSAKELTATMKALSTISKEAHQALRVEYNKSLGCH